MSLPTKVTDRIAHPNSRYYTGHNEDWARIIAYQHAPLYLPETDQPCRLAEPEQEVPALLTLQSGYQTIPP
ncbi:MULTISPECIES: hypothetical protein [Gluconobacter]|uniref:Uncharacterized protein n=1 Tax=Gluconobacter cerinus TaxID=38307 RepID=A0AAV5NJF9_9PROT|nr:MULTISPECIES: hypothetical protein [Gluconobacter]GFE98157.1 hypothetical protein DmGdi_32300 [Gluconobacter sp. Gdi]GLQ64250.1 hypothetical protein GCM10007867_30970 [Gluconobacter cerinus]